MKLYCLPHSTHLRPLCAFDLNVAFLLLSLPATSPPTYIAAPHPSKRVREHSLMDEGVPSLMWDGYSRSVFYRTQSFHPPKHFSCCIIIINYLLHESPTFTRPCVPIPRRRVCEPSIQPHAWKWGGGKQSISACEMNEWVMLPTGHSSGAMSSSPRPVVKNKQHLQGSTPSICSFPENSTPGLKVWF